MVAARRAAARMIDSLTSRDRFCAIAFDNTTESIPLAGLVAATDRQRFAAVEALAKVDARGGTELAQPLRLAQSMLAGGTLDRERVIVLVTDGQVGNEDHILRELSLRNIKMFTLGIDQAVNAAFLRRLAAAGGGLCELVESEDRLDEVMAKVHRRIGTPIATELMIAPTGLEIDLATVSPRKLPDVYAGAPVTILGRYRGAAPAAASVHLVGTSLGEPLREHLVRREHAYDARDRAWLAASWARAHIRDLEDRYAAGAREVESTIVAVSKRHGVLSRFTAFLAVDRAQIANAGGRLAQVVQPVDLPAGWDKGAMPLGGAGGPPKPAPPLELAQRMRVRATAAGAPPAMSAPILRAPAMPAAPMKKPAGSGATRAGARLSEREEARADGILAHEGGNEDTSDLNYLASLVRIARELEAHVRAGTSVTGIRLVRQRLLQWVEDVRSVGRLATAARTVEQLAARLATASADELQVIFTELFALATGTPSKQPTRGAFWK